MSSILESLRQQNYQIALLPEFAGETDLLIDDKSEVLSELTQSDEVQQAWSDSTTASDREEIRLRLSVLLHADAIHPALIPFITHNFRANDPALYQLAAQIAGKHLDQQPAFKSLIFNYVRSRGLGPGKPVQLNNQRSRRRILLSFAAWMLANPESSAITDSNGNRFPIQILPSIEKEGALSDPDISVLMFVCSLLRLTAPDWSNQTAENLIRARFTGTGANKSVTDKNLIVNAATCIRLMESINAPAASDLNALIWRFLIEQLDTSAGNIALQVRVLFLMKTWMKHSGLNNHVPSTKASMMEHSGTLETLNSVKLTDNEHLYMEFAKELMIIADKRNWLSLSVPARLKTAFRVLYLSLHPVISGNDDLRLLLSELQLATPAGHPRNMVPASVLKRLITLDSSFSAHIIDTQLIHRIADPDVLPALVPTAIPAGYIPALADAIEHQIQLQLSADIGFDPEVFLYRIAVRKPHISLFKMLAERTADREYVGGNGTVYPIQKLVERLVPEVAVSKNGPSSANSSTESEPVVLTADYVRDRLTQHCKSDDLDAALTELIIQLQGRGLSDSDHTDTIRDLLEKMQPPQSRWFKSGPSALTTRTEFEILQFMDTAAQRLGKLRTQLFPSGATLSATSSGFHNVAESAPYLLAELRENLLPLCSETDAHVFEAFLDRTKKLTDDWVHTLTGFTEFVRQHTSEANIKAFPGWLLELQRPSERMRIGLMYWEFMEFRNKEQQPGNLNWLSQAAKISDALEFDPPLKMAWDSRLAMAWSDVARQAMDNQDEHQISELVSHPKLESVRRLPGCTETIFEIKPWCLNRYDFRTVNSLNSIAKGHKAATFTLIDYIRHFGYVWLALLLGVILMFDFGDPWFELAEIGDFGGVVFSFLFGLAGTFLYVWVDLRKKTRTSSPTTLGKLMSASVRVSVFLSVTLVFTFLMVSLFWYMFSSTDQVVHGEYRMLHLVSWTGFALFIGVFLGLLGKRV